MTGYLSVDYEISEGGPIRSVLVSFEDLITTWQQANKQRPDGPIRTRPVAKQEREDSLLNEYLRQLATAKFQEVQDDR